MRQRDKNIRRTLLLLVSGGLLFPACLGAAPEAKAGAAARPTAKSPTPASKPAKKRAKSRSSSRRSSFKRRIARMEMPRERAVEIQQSLIDAGYLHQEPTGKWDAATRAAMLHYQTEHGFPATGLPEAKTLMKLGLGPHPLPADLDPSIQAQARASNTPENADEAEDEAAGDSPSQAVPQ